MFAASSPDFETLYKHRDFVRQVAARLLRDPADVDDVEQRTWLSVLGLGGRAPKDRLAWLNRVTRNHAATLRRSSGRVQEREAAAGRPERQPATLDIAERVEGSRLLVEAVLSLPEPSRTAVLLRYYDDLPPREIARRLDVPVETVRQRIHRGLARLREVLEARYGAEGRDLHSAIGALALPVGLVEGAPGYGAAALFKIVAVALVGVSAAWLGAVLQTSPAGPAPDLAVGGAAVQAAASISAEPVAAAVSARRAVAASQDAAPNAQGVVSGTVTLRIGDSFVFGQPEARRDLDPSEVDLYCLDLRQFASVACPRGGAAVEPSLSSVGLPETPSEAAGLIVNAPHVLAGGDEVFLNPKCSHDVSGLGFALGGDGRTYRLHLIGVSYDPDALKRSAEIGYTSVPTVEGGGRFVLPTIEGSLEPAVLEAIAKAARIGSQIPGQDFWRHLLGDFHGVEGLLESNPFGEELYLATLAPLGSEVVIDKRGALCAASGIRAEGKVVHDSYSAVAVLGAMEGEVQVKSYSYVYVDGPMRGSIDIQSYATVCLMGDLVGTLKVRSYTDLLLRGRILGDLDTTNSGWCDFYFDGYYDRATLEEMGDDRDQITLHVRNSDLAPGEHGDIGTWRKVIVGDPLWSDLTY